TLSGQRIIITVGSFVIILSLMVMIKYTRLGRAIVATSQDGEFATMMGVNTKKIYLVTYMISAGLAGIAGVLLSPIFAVYPWMGASIMIKSLVVCILGGLGSVEGAIIAGITIGILESVAVGVFGSAWRDVVAYLVLIIILYVRPNGFFGKRMEAGAG
ncbi:MAG: branched-chain amino acid ABC transporter permease, partial [Treponema sp.]|nr:branched-chain amino acid ABC transporter permease [Treponema sp.]